jgi:hypothetical protein
LFSAMANPAIRQAIKIVVRTMLVLFMEVLEYLDIKSFCFRWERINRVFVFA